MKQTSIGKTALVILSVTSFVLIISLGYHTWPWADDFLQQTRINSHPNILHYLIERYLNWDGRFLTIPALYQAFYHKYFEYELTSVLHAIIFCVSAYNLVLILFGKSFIKLSFYYKLLIYALLSAVLFYAFIWHISETVYWVTGGWYIVMLLIITSWYLYYRKIFHSSKKLTLLDGAGIFIFSIIAGSSSQNLGFGIICMLVFDQVLHYINYRNVKNIFNNYKVVFLIGVIIGLVFITMAPGNFLRAAHDSSYESTQLTLIKLIKNFIYIAYIYIMDSKPLVVASILVSFSLALLSTTNSITIRFFNINSSKNNDFHLEALKWMIGAFGTIVPMTLVPETANQRTEIFFHAFMFVFLIYFFTSTFIFLISKKPFIRHIKWLTTFIIVFVLSFHVSFLFNQNVKAYNVNKEITSILNTLQKLKEAGDRPTVEVKLMNNDIPITKKCHFITNDPENWINEALSTYFNLKSIKSINEHVSDDGQYILSF